MTEPHRQDSPVVVSRDGTTTVVTLNRPHRANALTLPMVADLWRIWETFEQDDDQRVLVLTGAGRNFCGGRDLDELATSRQRDEDQLAALRPAGAPQDWFFRLVPHVAKPTVAAVNGPAVAGGWALVQRCDMRVASNTATFRINEISHGLGAGNFLVELARQIPPAVAFELVQLGETISAQRAYEVGFLNRVVDPPEVLTVALALAATMGEFAPAALRVNKEAITRSLYPDHSMIWSYAQHAFDKLRRR